MPVAGTWMREALRHGPRDKGRPSGRVGGVTGGVWNPGVRIGLFGVSKIDGMRTMGLGVVRGVEMGFGRGVLMIVLGVPEMDCAGR